jgi:DnaJ homolog subfamily C member 3
MQAEDNAAKGKLRVSVEDYKAALAMDPDHTAYNVHLYLGLCKTLVRLGRSKEAISTCTEALIIDSELVDALTQVTCLPGIMQNISVKFRMQTQGF